MEKKVRQQDGRGVFWKHFPVSWINRDKKGGEKARSLDIEETLSILHRGRGCY